MLAPAAPLHVRHARQLVRAAEARALALHAKVRLLVAALGLALALLHVDLAVLLVQVAPARALADEGVVGAAVAAGLTAARALHVDHAFEPERERGVKRAAKARERKSASMTVVAVTWALTFDKAKR